MGQEPAKAAPAGAAKGVEDRFHLVGTVLDGKFKIDRVVAEGGFAVVYQGVHLSLERMVAVKVLKTPSEFNDEAREEFIDKFRFEAKTIARISHPQIVQVVEFGVGTLPDGVRAPYMVLEWLSGQTLDHELRARRLKGGRSPEEVMAIVKPVFEALAYAHDEGIAHRDIKPANMMLVDSRRGVSLRLLDFGIAKIMDENEEAGSGMTQTRTAMQAFSPKYAAPEQIGGARSGPWTDVHALGLIVTEMLTDMPPYDGRDITQRFAEALSPVRPTPRKRKVDVGAWEPVIARAVGIVPEERYINAGEFLAALLEALPNATHRPLGAPGVAASASATASVSGPNPLNPNHSIGDTTLSGSAVATDVSPVIEPVAPPARRATTGLIAVAAVALLAIVGVGARKMLSTHDDPPAPVAHHAVAPPTPPTPAVLPPVVEPPVQVVEPTPAASADAGVANVAASADASVAAVARTDPPGRRHTRPRGHDSAHDNGAAHVPTPPTGSNYTVE